METNRANLRHNRHLRVHVGFNLAAMFSRQLRFERWEIGQHSCLQYSTVLPTADEENSQGRMLAVNECMAEEGGQVRKGVRNAGGAYIVVYVCDTGHRVAMRTGTVQRGWSMANRERSSR